MVAFFINILIGAAELPDWQTGEILAEIVDQVSDSISLYFLTSEPNMRIIDIIIPSTLLTSAWVTLFFISAMILKLLAPLEYLRRFTLWWFKDLDAHPLRAIAKVAATLIVVGAFVLKAVRWGWLLV